MRIHSVEAIPVSHPEPSDFNALRHLSLCTITTDDGQVGCGESITQFPEANFAAKHMIDGMAEDLLGKDPTHTEALWRRNKDRAWWYGYGGGIASYAVSAIDIAHWDRKGKAANMSVLDLIGGPMHERLPAIASCYAHHSSIPPMVEEAQEWLSTGLQGVKTGFGKRGDARLGYDHDCDVDFVRAMREGIGKDRMLIIDNGIAIKLDVIDALRRMRAMGEFDLTWVEEPLGAWDPEGYANLRAKTSTRTAYGEREWTVAGFERVLATGAVDVVGVDPGRAEGITGFKEVCDRVDVVGHRRQANAHAWSAAIVTAASLAISCSSPACKVFELKPLRNPTQHDLIAEPFEHMDGRVYPPQGPGLGIEVVEDVVESLRSEKVLSV